MMKYPICKNIKPWTLFFALLVNLHLFNSNSLAQGGYAGAILRMGLASRSEAMGRAYSAVVGNPESVYYNPAAAGFMKNRMIDLSIRALPLDRNFAYIGFATRLRPGEENEPEEDKEYQYGGLALSWLHASVSNIDARDFNGEKYDTFSNSQDVFNFMFALRFAKAISVGIGAHIIWNRFPALGQGNKTIKANSAGLDFGLLLFPIEGIWLGASYKNINAKYTWDSSNLYDRGTQRMDKFPRIWRVGLATSRLFRNLLLAVDVEGSDLFDAKIYLGAAYQLQAKIRVRAGLRDGHPTFGGGYFFSLAKREAALHYAFVAQPNELSAEHVFSWSFTF